MPIYHVNQKELKAVAETTFGAEGILERKDLQRMLREQISVLDERLMVVAEEDLLIPADLSKAAFDRAGAPRALHVKACGHFEIYEDPWFSQVSDRMVEWFAMHLRDL